MFTYFTYNNMIDFDTGLAPVGEIIVFSFINSFKSFEGLSPVDES